jgi:hypothetical protein
MIILLKIHSSDGESFQFFWRNAGPNNSNTFRKLTYKKDFIKKELRMVPWTPWAGQTDYLILSQIVHAHRRAPRRTGDKHPWRRFTWTVSCLRHGGYVAQGVRNVPLGWTLLELHGVKNSPLAHRGSINASRTMTEMSDGRTGRHRHRKIWSVKSVGVSPRSNLSITFRASFR